MRRNPDETFNWCIVRRFSLYGALALLMLAACENPVKPGGEHLEAVDVALTELSGAVLAHTSDNAIWEGAPLVLDIGENRPLRVVFTDVYGEPFTLEGRSDHTLLVEVEVQRVASWTTVNGHGTLQAGQPGTTRLRVHIWHHTHADFSSPWITVQTRVAP